MCRREACRGVLLSLSEPIRLACIIGRGRGSRPGLRRGLQSGPIFGAFCSLFTGAKALDDKNTNVYTYLEIIGDAAERPSVNDSYSAFEWDGNKRRSNVEKHGIDFADATEAFDDPWRFTYRSPRRSNEERFLTVGTVRGKLIAIVFTLRGDKIRIISARPARRTERDQYGR